MLVEKLKRRKAERVVFKDINLDGRPDCLYLEKGGFMEFCFGKMEYMYKLLCMIQKKTGFEKPFLIKLFRRRPDALLVDDADGDGVHDIVYLEKSGFSHMRGGKNVFMYKLMLMQGKGDGSFSEPKQIAVLKDIPERNVA